MIMRFLYITLGACLLFTNLSLKAAMTPSHLAKLSSEKQGIYQQLKEDFPHLFQRISMYDEALKARDQGLLHVASHLKIEDALLRFKINKELLVVGCLLFMTVCINLSNCTEKFGIF